MHLSLDPSGTPICRAFRINSHYTIYAPCKSRKLCAHLNCGGVPLRGTRVYALNCGGVAQMVRAHGSYPCCQWFNSTRRYHPPSPLMSDIPVRLRRILKSSTKLHRKTSIEKAKPRTKFICQRQLAKFGSGRSRTISVSQVTERKRRNL